MRSTFCITLSCVNSGWRWAVSHSVYGTLHHGAFPARNAKEARIAAQEWINENVGRTHADIHHASQEQMEEVVAA